MHPQFPAAIESPNLATMDSTAQVVHGQSVESGPPVSDEIVPCRKGCSFWFACPTLRTAFRCFFLLLVSSLAVPAANRDAPVHKVDGSFVREWLVLGPFPSPEIGADFLAEAGREANVRPKEGDAVTRKDGTIWTGGSHGICRVENGTVVRVQDYSWVNALTSDDRGNLWFGDGWEEGGLLRFNPVSRAVKDGLPINRVFALEAAADGGLWVGTEIGLARYRDEKVEDLRKKLGIATGAVWEISIIPGRRG